MTGSSLHGRTPAGRMGLKVLPGVAGGGTPCSGFVSPVKRLTRPRTSGRAPSSGSVAFVKRLTKLTKPRTSGARYAIASRQRQTTHHLSQEVYNTKLYDSTSPTSIIKVKALTRLYRGKGKGERTTEEMYYGPAHTRRSRAWDFRNHLDEPPKATGATFLWKVTNCSGHPKRSSRRYDRTDRTFAFLLPLPRVVLTSPSAAPAARAQAAVTRDARRDRIVTSTGRD